EGGGVEGVSRGFGGHARGGELPQFVVDEREQLGGGLAVTGRGGFQEAGHVGHEGRGYRLGGAASPRTWTWGGSETPPDLRPRSGSHQAVMASVHRTGTLQLRRRGRPAGGGGGPRPAGGDPLGGGGGGLPLRRQGAQPGDPGPRLPGRGPVRGRL